MVRIKLSHNWGNWPLLRQTPGGLGVWGDCQFFVNQEIDQCDYWVVLEGIERAETCICPPGNLIFITHEPTPVRYYKRSFVDQFSLLLTEQRWIRPRRVVYRQQALPWHAGVRRKHGQGGSALERDEARFSYDDFKHMRDIPKTRHLSVICSARTETAGHRSRIEFVHRLKEHFKDRLDWFGKGFQPIEDKWDAIAPYRFHLALENNALPHYWTEKLADTYLAGTFPIYAGCPNIGSYFEPAALQRVDVADAERAIRDIERLLREGISPSRQAAVVRARERVLDEYNLFPTLVALKERCRGGQPRSVTLRPEPEFSRTQPKLERIARRLHRFRSETIGA